MKEEVIARQLKFRGRFKGTPSFPDGKSPWRRQEQNEKAAGVTEARLKGRGPILVGN